MRKCASVFMRKIIQNRCHEIRVSDFFKKSHRVRKKLDRAYNFQKRKHKRADEAFIAGDYE